MFYLVNMETRNILTYKDASRITYAAYDLACRHAEAAQHVTGHPFQVIGVSMPVTNVLGREVAPWFK